MADEINWTPVLQLANLVGVAHLAGYHWASDQIAMHNILRLRDRDAIAEGWFRGWDFGRVYGPAMVTGTAAVFGFMAWKDGTQSPSFPYHLAASVLIGFVAPYTKFRVFPINDKLLAEHERMLSRGKKSDKQAEDTSFEQVLQWAAEWKRLDLHRQLLVCAATVAGLIAAVKS
ncbi:hypothetical protein CMUS01_12873 [Colletotrichum musicola]|uniref:Anthrone oxygenase encC n=1 Tax=Colletotrichum musicola TaxID=2175873 RepID=A0A8H6JIL7_9PEZI|nr:hypothetical protein CMUS01_12873 [Colletotrichum musicola]